MKKFFFKLLGFFFRKKKRGAPAVDSRWSARNVWNDPALAKLDRLYDEKYEENRYSREE